MSMDAYMPHGYCFLWQPPLVALHVVSDTLIALAYFSIPLMLIYFVRKRGDVPFRGLFRMFGMFIVLCGITHLMAVVTIWDPLYWIDGAFKAATAGISVATAFVLFPAIPKALQLRSPVELERVNAELRGALAKQEELLAAYQRQRTVATALQEALLPHELPQRPGIAFASSYRAASADAEVGGDWFDAFTISEHQIGISCGDVAGHGLAAASLMGTTRQMVRTAAREDDDPSAVLGRVNRALCAEDNELLVTAFYGVFDTASGRLRFASAGHPAPLVVDPAGNAAYLSSDGLLLGLDARTAFVKGEVTLREGSLLVMYTDGIVEAERNVLQGLDQLAKAATRIARTRPVNPAAAIHAAVLGDVRTRDDAAVLTLTIDRLSDVGPDARRRTWHIDVAEGRAGQAFRKAFMRYLAEHAAPASDFFAAEMIVGELLANVAQHTPGDARVDVSLGEDGAKLIVEDHGPPIVRVAETDPLSEHGRGLSIVRAFGTQVTIDRTGEGNRISVVLPVTLSSRS